MDRYNIKFTIPGLWGVYAEKYSFTVNDAQLLDALIQATSKNPIPLFERHDEPQFFDPLPVFTTLMKKLRNVAHKYADRRFLIGVRPDTDGEPGPWLGQIEGEDADGRFVVEGLGKKAQILRPDAEDTEPIDLSKAEEVVWQNGDTTYRWRFNTRSKLFKAALEGIVMICEECMAKGVDLQVTTFAIGEQPPRPPTKAEVEAEAALAAGADTQSSEVEV